MILGTFLFSSFVFADVPSNWQEQLDKSVQEKTKDRLFIDGAISVISSEGSISKTYGRTNSKTLFEIGSLTKTFTGILFAKLIVEKKIEASDTVEKFIPELVGTHAGSIRLDELATHTSGLAKIPENINVNSKNPYSSYSAEKLIRTLKSTTPTTGTSRPFPMEYSNTGFALLGIILSKVENLSYNDLLNKHITGPLGMKSTRINSGKSYIPNFAFGHTVEYSEFRIGRSFWELISRVPHWTFISGFEATGGIISNIEDMSLFLKAILNFDPNNILGQAIAISQQEFWGWDTPFIQSPSLFKQGATGGFRSDLIVDHSKKFGIVLLTNTNDEPEDLLSFLVNSN